MYVYFCTYNKNAEEFNLFGVAIIDCFVLRKEVFYKLTFLPTVIVFAPLYEWYSP